MMTETKYIIERGLGSDWRPAADWKPDVSPKNNLDEALAALASMRAAERHGGRYRLLRVTRKIIDA